MKTAPLEKVKIFSSGKALFLGENGLEHVRYIYNKTYKHCKYHRLTQRNKIQNIMNVSSYFHGHTKPPTNNQD